MKKQTYIVYIYDEPGKMIGFERFCCKKIETVLKHMNTLFKNDLYRVCNSGAAKIQVYRTPDGITKDGVAYEEKILNND